MRRKAINKIRLFHKPCIRTQISSAFLYLSYSEHGIDLQESKVIRDGEFVTEDGIVSGDLAKKDGIIRQ